MEEVKQAARNYLDARIAEADQETITRLADRLAMLVVTKVIS